MKILFVLQTPWGTGLGMSKVHFDLKKEYEKLGHHVDYLDWNMLYPKGQSAFDKISGPLYSVRILGYLKSHASKYDVIDANFNCIPYPKSDYGFKGVVLYRSHGLQPLYRQIEQSAAYKRMEAVNTLPSTIPLKTRLGNLNRYLQRKDTDVQLFNSILYADIVHALNEAECNYYIEYGVPEEKICLISNGIPDEQIQPASDILRKRKNEISFVGSWTLRKGIRDLNSIIKEAQKSTHIDKINILGGGGSPADVYPLFDKELHHLLHIQPHFTQQELPFLLADTKVGIFPSYVEGFGLAILEQLASGIPVVAYSTPGPSNILKPFDEELLSKAGNITELGKKVACILSLPDEQYNKLALLCRNRAEQFKMSKVAVSFIDVYKTGMNRINKKEDNETTVVFS